MKWRNSWERWGWLQWKRFSDKLVVTHPYKHVARDFHLEEKCRASTFLVLLAIRSGLEWSESNCACFWQTFRVRHLPSSESHKVARRRNRAPAIRLQKSPDLHPDCPSRFFHSLAASHRGWPWLLLTLIGLRNDFLRSGRGDQLPAKYFFKVMFFSNLWIAGEASQAVCWPRFLATSLLKPSWLRLILVKINSCLGRQPVCRVSVRDN